MIPVPPPALVIAPVGPIPGPAPGGPPVVHFAPLQTDLYYEAFNGQRIKITLTQAQRDRLEPILNSKNLNGHTLSLLDLIKIDDQGRPVASYDDDDDDIQQLKQIVTEIAPGVVFSKRISAGNLTHDDAPIGFEKTGYRLKNADFNEDVLKKAIRKTGPVPPVAGAPPVVDFTRDQKIEKIESYFAANFLTAKIEETLLAMKTDLERQMNDPTVPQDQKQRLKPHLEEITNSYNYVKDHLDRFAVKFGATHKEMNDMNDRMASANDLIVASMPLIRQVPAEDQKNEERYRKDLAIMEKRARIDVVVAARQLQIPEQRLTNIHHLSDAVHEMVAPGPVPVPVRDIVARMRCLKFINEIPPLGADFFNRIGNSFQDYSNAMVARRTAVSANPAPAAPTPADDDALIAALRDPAPIQVPGRQPAPAAPNRLGRIKNFLTGR